MSASSSTSPTASWPSPAGEIDEPDAVLDTDQTTLMSLLRSERPLDDILASGNLRLAGDRGIVERFRRLFPLPQPITIADRT